MHLCLCMYIYICVWTSCVLCVLSTHSYIWWTSTICSLQTWTPLLANVCLSCKANTWRVFAEKDSQVTKQRWLIQDQLWKIRHPSFYLHGANKCPTYSYLLLCCPYLGFFLAMLLFKMVPIQEGMCQKKKKNGPQPTVPKCNRLQCTQPDKKCEVPLLRDTAVGNEFNFNKNTSAQRLCTDMLIQCVLRGSSDSDCLEETRY